MNTHACRAVVLVLCLLFGADMALADAAKVYATGDFAGWTFDVIKVDSSEASMTVLGSGGNPGSCVAVTTVTGESTYCVMWHPASIWSPATDGALVSVSMSIDTRSITAWGNGQEIGILAIQNGKYFRYRPEPFRFVTGPSTTWHTVQILDAAPSDFGATWGPAGGSGTLDATISGSPITFGFYAGNRVSGTFTNHYDNWSVELVPEPATIGLLALGLVGLLSRRSVQSGRRQKAGCHASARRSMR